MIPTRILLPAGWILAGLAAPAETPSDHAIKQLAADYFAKRPSEVLHAGLTLAEARHAQEAFVGLLIPQFGDRAGFKVGLTSKAAQESLGASAPVRGVILRGMLRQDGAEVSAKFGARPIWEPDLVVTVKDEGINTAKTQLEAARHLDEIVAFLELPDRIVAESGKSDGPLITAVNAGARLGVLGSRARIEPTPEFIAALERLRVTATDQNNTELAKADGTALLGHPLNPVLWLIEDLKASGVKLKAGDLISLGSFAKPQPPQPGQTVTVRYEGLPGGPFRVSVRFSD